MTGKKDVGYSEENKSCMRNDDVCIVLRGMRRISFRAVYFIKFRFVSKKEKVRGNFMSGYLRDTCPYCIKTLG